jgi:hypothetical protein
MARYEKPPDPRKEKLRERRPRRQQGQGSEPIPWLWLGLGVLVTIASIFLALSLVNTFLERPPLTVASAGSPPTIIRLTAPATQVPTLTPVQATGTPIPTLTPIPTPDVSTPPPQLTVGFYARVTPDIGVTVRGGPSTQNIAVTVADFGELLLIIDGPTQGSDFEWWQIRRDDGTQGWVAGDFIEPAPGP